MTDLTANPRIMDLLAAASQASAHLEDREDPSERELRERLWNAIEAVTQADTRLAQGSAAPEQEGEDYWRGYKAGLADQSGGGVLQAVLDAIHGTLDPHSQIADHPNVKVAQMERLKLLEAARGNAQEARPQGEAR